MKAKRRLLAILISLTMVFGTLPSAVFAENGEGADNGASGEAQAGVSEEAREMVESGDIADDQVIVVFEEGVSASKAKAICESNDVDVQKVATLDGQKAVLAETDDGQSVAEAITEIDKERKVAYVQPNYKYTIDAADPMNNDTSSGQWYLKNINAREAAEELSVIEGDKVSVAVIDTGADVSHEDLQKNINKGLSVQTDHKGGTKPLIDDADEHGTHVTGIIAATFDNGKGIAGVSSLSGNKVADVFVVDAFTPGGMGGWFDTFDLVSAVKYVTDKGAKVFNMSVGGYGRDRYLESAFEYAYANDVVPVVAAGNEGAEVLETPANFGCVVSVCATTKENRRAYYSSLGVEKDIAAPGTNVLSTLPGGDYGKMSGTSMASPVVAAAAACVRYANPSLTAPQVKNILYATADPSVGDNKEGFDKGTGYGLLDMKAAVEAAKEASADVPAESISIRKGAEDILISRGDTFRIEPLVLPAESLAEVTYESSDPGIAEVDETGLVTAVGSGAAVITAKAGDKTCETNVYVDSKDVPEEVTITDSLGNPLGDDMTIPSAESVTKTYYPSIYVDGAVTPASAVQKDEIAWISSDLNIVTADEYGMLTGHDTGDAVLTAKTYNGKTDTITIHVRKAASSVKFTDKTETIKAGKTYTFKASASPSDAADKDVWFRSSNRKTGTIGKTTGKFTAKNAGKTTITAYTKYGAKRTVRVTVTKAAAASTGSGASASAFNPFIFGDSYDEKQAAASIIMSTLPARIRDSLAEIWDTTGSKKKNIKSSSREVFETFRQQLLEEVDEEMTLYAEQQNRYCSVIWDEILQAYDECSEAIYSTESIDELYEVQGTYLSLLYRTAGLTKDKVKKGTAAELKTFKESKIKQLKTLYDKKKKAGSYNAFYSDRLEDSYYTGKKEINNAERFGDAATYYSTARAYINSCKTVKAFKTYRENTKKSCRAAVIKPLVKSDYTTAEWNLINKLFEQEMGKIDKAPSAEEIGEIEEGLFDLIFNSLPANEQYRNSLYMKYSNMLENAFLRYDESDYSSAGFEKLEDAFWDAVESMECALTNKAEEKRALAGIAKMKKVPNYSQELKALKKDRKAKLSKYVGNKKYVQKKVKPIVKKGKAAIDKCKTLKKVKAVFKTYKKKAEATIKKFRIKSSAGKGGTITDSKTVKYGSKAVFVIKASKGYKTSELKVDGKKVKIVKKYTFKNVRKNHTIKVKFKEK